MTGGRRSPSGEAAGTPSSGGRNRKGNGFSSSSVGMELSLEAARRGISERTKGSSRE